MNAVTKNLFLLLLLSSVFVLPACGGKEIKSEKKPETVFKSADIPAVPPMIMITPTVAVSPTQTVSNTISASSNTYTKQMNTVKRVALVHKTKKAIPMMAAPLVSPVPTISTPIAVFTPAIASTEKKSGSHWPLIVAGGALVIALGFYFWTKKAPPHNDFPLPPMGGLSPVSGFTAMRNKVQQETKKQSTWSKKVF